MVTVTCDRVRVGAPGSAGGGPGMPAYGWYIKDYELAAHADPLDLRVGEPLFGMFDSDGLPDPNHGEYCLGARYNTGKFSGLVLKAGDAVRFVIGGGGGWGDPLARDPAKVQVDVRNELVSEEFARLGYGVVLTSDQIDQDATAALRAELAARRDQGQWAVPVASPVSWSL